MKFGRLLVEEARGGVLAHTHRLVLADRKRVLKKGTVLDASMIVDLRAAGLTQVWAAFPEPGDLAEDEAAEQVASVCLASGLRVGQSRTGRVNIFSTTKGRFEVQERGIHRANRLDARVTLSTLPSGQIVEADTLVATVKIIPFAVPSRVIEAVTDVLGSSPLRLDRLHPLRTALIVTELDEHRMPRLEQIVQHQRERIELLGGQLRWVMNVSHEVTLLSNEVQRMVEGGAELILILGASSVVDEEDVVPASIVDAGGTIVQVGMPVDPGNLLVMATIGRSGPGSKDEIPVVGIPGCARSPKRNGFDIVLERLFSKRPADASFLRSLGVGGLLDEIELRPSPRAPNEGRRAETPSIHHPRLAAVVLAAGMSTRMGPQNKLTALVEGKAMLTRVVDQLLSAPFEPVFVVLGHQAEKVQEVIAHRPVQLAFNPHFMDGLSTSLVAGIDALPPAVDGVLIALGDMPLAASVARRLVPALVDCKQPRIVVPTWRGRRGNPVLFSHHFFALIQGLKGDRGARTVIMEHPEAVVEVPVEEEGILLDVDTPQSMDAMAHRIKSTAQG